MKVNVENISPVKKKVSVEISGDEVISEIDSFYKELGKTAQIKGFRPGKVPRGILERYFKDHVKGEVLQKMVQESAPKAFTEAALQPVSPPVIDHQELEIGKPFQYSATIEVKPEISIQDYLGLNIDGKKEGVTDEEVEERLKALQNLQANLKTIAEVRPIQKGDYVILDYEGRMGGKPIEGGKATDFTIEVGSGRFIPDFEEKLIGLNPEEEREIEVSFPGDYGYQKWAGKTIPFQVKIKEIKEKVLPLLDDEFAKDVGDYSSLEELKAKLRQEIEKAKELAFDRQLKDQIKDHLLNANPFEIPESLVEGQIHALISETRARLASQGVDFEKLGVSEKKLHDDYRELAERQVRTFLILEKIAGLEGIAVADEEVEARLREVAERTNQRIDIVKRYYEQNELIPELKAGIMSDKTLDFLLQKANVTYP